MWLKCHLKSNKRWGDGGIGRIIWSGKIILYLSSNFNVFFPHASKLLVWWIGMFCWGSYGQHVLTCKMMKIIDWLSQKWWKLHPGLQDWLVSLLLRWCVRLSMESNCLIWRNSRTVKTLCWCFGPGFMMKL